MHAVEVTHYHANLSSLKDACKHSCQKINIKLLDEQQFTERSDELKARTAAVYTSPPALSGAVNTVC